MRMLSSAEPGYHNLIRGLGGGREMVSGEEKLPYPTLTTGSTTPPYQNSLLGLRQRKGQDLGRDITVTVPSHL